MSAVPVLPLLSPARRAADLAQSRALRVALGAGALAAITALLARRVDLSSLAECRRRVGLDRRRRCCSTWPRSPARRSSGRRRSTRCPGQRPVRYGHVVPALFIGFLLNTVLFARVGELARVAVLARRRGWPGRAFPRARSRGTALAEQLVLGVALALAVVALAPVLHLPHMVWQLADRLRARADGRLRRADGRDAQGARPPRRSSSRASRSGQALFSQPRATALAMTAGTLSWAAQIAGIWAALEAFGIHVGLAGAGLVFVSSTIVQLFPSGPATSASSSSAWPRRS